MPNVAIAGSNCYHFGFLNSNKMDKLKLDFYEIEWEDEISGIPHSIEDENALNECVNIAVNLAVLFGEWLDSLNEEDMGEKTIKDLFSHFRRYVYRSDEAE